ncbi:MAG: type II secretion system protein [Myxococcota bacterium]
MAQRTRSHAPSVEPSPGDPVVGPRSPSPPVERRRGRNAGFTLLEVLVAVAILSITLASLLSSQMASMRATAHARQLSSVAFLAEGQLVEIEWTLKQDGWGQDDQVFEGDFAEEGWPDVEYLCIVDLIEMPDYNELVAAKDAADTDGDDDFIQDAGEQAFGMLGMVWPIISEAIEQSIRKSWCTVRWARDGNRKKLSDEWLCGDDEIDCLTIATFWTDPEKLKQLPALGGGEVTEDDVDGGDEGGQPGGEGGGRDGGGGTSRPSTGRGGGGGGGGGIGLGGGRG